MKKLTLRSEVDEETGVLGLLIDGVRSRGMFVASEGLLIAHDIIEHQNGLAAIGPIDDEFQALGGIWFVRGQLFDLRRDGMGSAHTPHEHVAADVARMYRDYCFGEPLDTAVPRTTATDLDEDFADILRIARHECLAEVDAQDRKPLEPYLRAALAHMRIGYRKAVRRFRGRDANAQFWAIAEAVDRATKQVEFEGQRFHLAYGDGTARCEEIYEEGY